MWAGSVSLVRLSIKSLVETYVICVVITNSTHSPFVSLNRLEVTLDISQRI